MSAFESYNLVNKIESESRNFSRYDIVLEMYFDRFGHVIFIGTLKNADCFWFSRTNTSDMTINAGIFKYIWSTTSAPVSWKSKALCSLNISDMDLKKYYYSARIYIDKNCDDIKIQFHI